jgi:hypothetical protein
MAKAMATTVVVFEQPIVLSRYSKLAAATRVGGSNEASKRFIYFAWVCRVCRQSRQPQS